MESTELLKPTVYSNRPKSITSHIDQLKAMEPEAESNRHQLPNKCPNELVHHSLQYNSSNALKFVRPHKMNIHNKQQEIPASLPTTNHHPDHITYYPIERSILHEKYVL